MVGLVAENLSQVEALAVDEAHDGVAGLVGDLGTCAAAIASQSELDGRVAAGGGEGRTELSPKD